MYEPLAWQQTAAWKGTGWKRREVAQGRLMCMLSGSLREKHKRRRRRRTTPSNQTRRQASGFLSVYAINLRTIWGWYFLSIYGNIGESLWNWVYLILRRCLKSWWYPKCIETTMVTTGNRNRWRIPTRRSDPRCWAPSVRLGEMSNDTVVGYRL